MDNTKIFGFQKSGFIELVALEARQGAKEEWNAASHILNKLVVFVWGRMGHGFGTRHPSQPRDVGQASLKCEDICWSFLYQCEIYRSRSVFHPHYNVIVHYQKH